MSDRFVVDPPQLDLRLKQLRLPAMRTLWRTASPSAPTARGGPRCACWRAAMSGSGKGRTCSCSGLPI